MDRPDVGDEAQELEDALLRLREVLAAPDRGSWRRHLPGWRRGHGGETRAGDAAGMTRRGLRRWAALPVLGAAVVLLVSAFRPPTAVPAHAPDPAATPPAAASGGPSVDPAPAAAPPPVPAPPERIWPGAGFSVEGNVVRRGDDAWSAGGPGDVVVLGDWDCDGAPTAGVLRPSDGAFFVFDRWAEEEVEVVATEVASVPGAVSAESSGCGAVALRTAAGVVHEVPVDGGRA